MAQLPCAFERHRFRGKSCHAYIGILDGATSIRRSLRLCPQHLEQLLEEVKDFQLDPDATNYPSRTSCAACGRRADGASETTNAIYVTAYPRSADQLDFYALAHTSCRLPTWAETMITHATGGADYGPGPT